MKQLLIFSVSIFFTCINIIAQTSTPSFGNPGPIRICINGSYYLNPSTTDGTWASSNTAVAMVNTSGYVTGLTLGTATITLTNNSGTASATITVGSTSSNVVISDPSALPNYKFDNSEHGPIDGTINYIGYNGFDFASQTPPINTGYYRASKQLNAEAGCPYEYYIIKCDACNSYSIIQSGLVLNLDAGNPSSYAGNGTVWNDLSEMHNDMNISSQLESKYSSSFNGFFNFDGDQINTIENDAINGANISTTNAVTFEVWVNQNTVSGYQFWVSTIGCCDYRFGLYDGGGLFWNMGDHSDITNGDTPLIAGNWYQMVISSGFDGVSIKTNIYINGILKTTFDEGRTSLPNINSIFIGSGEGSSQYLLNAKLSVIRIYKKTLNASDVLKNFNALKSRYGL